MKTNTKIKELTLIALFMALIIVGSRIYIGSHDSFRFHLGNSMCLLAAFLLSPISAGIASGVGSMIFDLLFYPNGLGCLVTLITKFVMGFVASFLFNKVIVPRNIQFNLILRCVLSGIIGEVCYIILYAIKTFIERRYIMGLQIEVVIPILYAKVGASIVNAVIAVIISSLVYNFLRKTTFLNLK